MSHKTSRQGPQAQIQEKGIYFELCFISILYFKN